MEGILRKFFKMKVRRENIRWEILLLIKKLIFLYS